MIDVGAVYDRYAKDVYRFALYLSGNRAQAEDITSETFARAWGARDQIRVGTVKAYLLMIARNLYRDGQRRDWRARELEPGLLDPAPIRRGRPETGTRCGACSTPWPSSRKRTARRCCSRPRRG
jgi:RNA polymerase sigma factor (sigma-70 family)